LLVVKGMIRCYYCERFNYDMHPEWIDFVIKKQEKEDDPDKEDK